MIRPYNYTEKFKGYLIYLTTKWSYYFNNVSMIKLDLKKKLFQSFFYFNFCIQDFSLDTALTNSKHMEGTVSQNFDIGPSYFFM